RRPLLVEGDRLRLRAIGELPRVSGVHLVEDLSREVRQRLARGDGLDDMAGGLIAAGDVMGGDGDRPLLGGSRLLPVGVAQGLEESRGLLNPGLELPGELLSLGSHEHPPWVMASSLRRTTPVKIDKASHRGGAGSGTRCPRGENPGYGSPCASRSSRTCTSAPKTSPPMASWSSWTISSESTTRSSCSGMSSSATSPCCRGRL